MKDDSVGPSTPTTPSRRRARLDSSSSQSAATMSKRPRHEAEAAPPSTPSARSKGKMPERALDLTKPPVLQPHSGAKRLVIKNLKTSTGSNQAAEEYYARAHKELAEGVDAVLEGREQDVTLERLYHGVENICRRGNQDVIYGMLKSKMEGHVNSVILPKIEKNGQGQQIDTARAAFAEWQLWNTKAVC